MKDYQYRLELDVRDYECDLAGMVNNANYLHYLEHARHIFIRAVGTDFAELAKRGIFLSVIRIEIDYLFPLRSGDKFYVGTNMVRISRLRFGFLQDIYRIPDDKPIVQAKVIGTAINEKGRPQLPKEIEDLLPDELSSSQ